MVLNRYSEITRVDYQINLSGKTDYGIGIVGAGKIVRSAHIPAYQRAGFKIVAAADINCQARQTIQKTLGIGEVFEDYRKLLELKEVEIVDVAVHHRDDDVRMKILRDALNAGKHVLMQKPMAKSYKTAKEMVRIAESFGRVKFAINQSYRWSPAQYAAKRFVEEGYIGDPRLVTIEFVHPMSFSDRCLTMSVHHYDFLRWCLNEQPLGVYGSAVEEAYGTVITILEYDNERQALVCDNGWNGGIKEFEKNQQYHRLRIEGTEGRIKANMKGTYVMAPDSIELYSSFVRGWFKPLLDPTLAYPIGGMMGSMGDFMQSIEQDRKPTCHGEDNLKTLQIVFAAIKSQQEKRMISPSEIV